MRALVSLLASLLLVAGCGPGQAADAGLDAALADTPAADTPADAGSLDVATPLDVPGDGGGADVAADAGCAADLAAIEASLPGLFFTSEGDHPLVLETFAGEGGAAPTPADVVRLSMAPAGASTETRDVATFWPRVVIDPTAIPKVPDTRPAMLQAAVEAALTDLTFVRVIDPASPVQVRVYLVGRACGAIVWLSSTSIET